MTTPAAPGRHGAGLHLACKIPGHPLPPSQTRLVSNPALPLTISFPTSAPTAAVYTKERFRQRGVGDPLTPSIPSSYAIKIKLGLVSEKYKTQWGLLLKTVSDQGFRISSFLPHSPNKSNLLLKISPRPENLRGNCIFF